MGGRDDFDLGAGFGGMVWVPELRSSGAIGVGAGAEGGARVPMSPFRLLLSWGGLFFELDSGLSEELPHSDSDPDPDS